MPIDACKDDVLAALGRDQDDLSKAEKAAIARHASTLKAKIDAGANPADVLKSFTERQGRIKEARKLIAAANELAFQAAQERNALTGAFATKAPGEVLKSLTVSSLKTFHGSQDSLGKRITYASAAAQAAYRAALDAADMSDYVFKGQDQLNIWKAFEALNREQDASPFGANAVKAATILRNAAFRMFKRQTDEHMPVGKIEEWIGPQGHDPYALQKAGFDTWLKDVLPNMNWEKSYGGEFLNAADSLKIRRLRSSFTNLVAGKHLEYGMRDPTEAREIYFKDAEAAYNYNQKYSGGRTLAENMDGWLGRAGRDTEIWKMMGSNPENFIRKVSNDLGHKVEADTTLTPEQEAKAKSGLAKAEQDTLRKWLPSLTGSLNTPEGAAMHYAYQASQLANALAVGAATPVLIGDLPLFMNTMARYGGDAMKKRFGYVQDTIGKFAEMSPVERKKAAALGEILLQETAHPLSRGNQGEYVAGAVHNVEKYVMKYAGHTPWVDRIRPAVATMFGALHWFEKDSKFADLDPAIRDGFTKFGIGEKEWDVIRASNAADIHSGTKAFGPSLIRETDPKVADRYREFLTSMADSVTTSPSAEMQAITSMGQNRNSLPGFALKMFNGLKSFTYKLTRDHYGQMIAGDTNPENVGWDKLLTNFINGDGGEPGGRPAVAKFLANNIFFGILITQLTALRNGEAPQVPDTPEKMGDALFKGFIRQGGGIYGDMLAGQLERPDKSFFDVIGSMFAPIVGDAADVADATKRIGAAAYKMQTNPDYTQDQFEKALGRNAAQLARVGYSLVPGTNFVATKWATDWYLKDSMLDAINPGYKQRLTQRAKKEDRTLLFAPP